MGSGPWLQKTPGSKGRGARPCSRVPLSRSVSFSPKLFPSFDFEAHLSVHLSRGGGGEKVGSRTPSARLFFRCGRSMYSLLLFLPQAAPFLIFIYVFPFVGQESFSWAGWIFPFLSDGSFLKFEGLINSLGKWP